MMLFNGITFLQDPRQSGSAAGRRQSDHDVLDSKPAEEKKEVLPPQGTEFQYGGELQPGGWCMTMHCC